MTNYQLGYTLAGAGLLALGLLAWLRPRGAIAFICAVLAMIPFAFPLPGITPWIWSHLPRLVVTITNIWPMQRLFAIWGLVIVFAAAMAAADPRISATRRGILTLCALLIAGAIWSGAEAAKLIRVLRSTRTGEAAMALSFRPENVELTRYAYASFALVPEYVSHSYMDPVLENRLLDRASGALLISNSDAAAPAMGTGAGSRAASRLVQSGRGWRRGSQTPRRWH